MQRELVENLAELIPGDLVQYTWTFKPEGTDLPVFLFLSLDEGIQSLHGMSVPGQTLNLLRVSTNEKLRVRVYEPRPVITGFPESNLQVYRLKDTQSEV